MSRCACCRAPIAIRSMATRAGPLRPAGGLCRTCLRVVDPSLRRELRRCRRAIRRAPGVAEIVALERIWGLVLAEAVWARQERRAA
jgi:hypothetical protein